MLQLNVGYSAPDTAVTCAVASVNGSVIDFVFSPATQTDPNTLIPDAARSGARLFAGQNGHDEIVVTMPSVSYDDSLEQTIAEHAPCVPANVSVEMTPAAFPSALARGYIDDIHRGALVETISEPVSVYTDASVQEGRATTGGIILVDADGYIVTFGMRELNGARDIADAELRAGFIGLSVALHLGLDAVDWVSDNQTAQGVVTGVTEWDTPTAQRLRDIVATFDTCSVTDIRGRENILADALAADARHDTISTPSVYTAPPISSPDIKEAYGQHLVPAQPQHLQND